MKEQIPFYEKNKMLIVNKRNLTANRERFCESSQSHFCLGINKKEYHTLSQGQIKSLNKLNLESIKSQTNTVRLNRKFFNSGLKLLGGGAACSSACSVNVKPQTLQRKELQYQLDNLNPEFQCEFEKLLVKKHLNEVINSKQQAKEISRLISTFSEEYKQNVFHEIESYRIHIIEALNFILKYIFSWIFTESSSTFEQDVHEQFQSFKQKIQQQTVFCQSIDIDFLLQLMDDILIQRDNLLDYNQLQRETISKFVGEFVKHEDGPENKPILKTFGSLSHSIKLIEVEGGETLSESIKSIVEINSEKISSRRNSNFETNKTPLSSSISQVCQHLIRIWYMQVEEFEKKKEVKIIDQIEFYIDRFLELKNLPNTNEIAVFVLVQIHHLIETGYNNNKHFECPDSQFHKDLLRRLPSTNSKMKQFISIMQMKALRSASQSLQSQQNAKSFAQFSFSNTCFRFLAAQILLRYCLIVKMSHDKEEIENYSNHLFYLFLAERNHLMQLMFLKSDCFFEFIDERLKENPKIYQKLIELQNSREKELRNIGVTQESLEQFEERLPTTEEDFNLKLNEKFIDKWVIDMKSKLSHDRLQKDELLIEVQSNYINQSFSFVSGQNIFEDKGLLITNEGSIDALQAILNQFLAEFKSNNETNKHDNLCQNQPFYHLLCIFGEGGIGKSMLLRKIDTYLIDNFNSQDKVHQNLDYIPLLIPCNALDFQKPSVNGYLHSQGMDLSQIQLIKGSDRYKVLLLDGFDQYQGEFFNIYEGLNLQDWQNTLVVVTSRNEQFTGQEINKYFSSSKSTYTNTHPSYTIVNLNLFNSKDIIEFSQNHFQNVKGQSENSNRQMHKVEVIKDIVKTNKILGRQLELPVNIFFFVRFIELFEEDSETGYLKQMKQNNIQFEEMLLEKIFENESKKVLVDLNIKQTNRQLVQNLVKQCYFTYFQNIAIKMLVNKGKVPNYLHTDKLTINEFISIELQEILEKQKCTELLNRICSFKNSSIVIDASQNKQPNNNMNYVNTFSYLFKNLFVNPENSPLKLGSASNKLDFIIRKSNSAFKHSFLSSFTMNKITEDKQPAEKLSSKIKLKGSFQFRNKQLFEYFAARAMKFDFDYYNDNISLLSSEKLRSFSINQKILYHPLDHTSESQILIKFYQMIKEELDSSLFINSYSKDDPLQVHKFIQYIQRTRLFKIYEQEQLDIGSSNLLTALFLSNFQYPYLDLSNCSFSRSYLPQKKHEQINLCNSNLKHAYLRGSNLNVDHSCTTNAFFSIFQEHYSYRDSYTFQAICLREDNQIFSISATGALNNYQIQGSSFSLINSKKIGLVGFSHFLALNEIYNIASGNVLYQISAKSLEVIKVHTFNKDIVQVSLSNDKRILLALGDGSLLIGEIYEEFSQIKTSQVKTAFLSQSGLQFLTINTILEKEECKIYEFAENKQEVKETDSFSLPSKIASIILSSNSRFLALNLEDQTSQIRSTKNKFKLISQIQGHILQIASADDSKQIAFTQQKNQCQIFEVIFENLHFAKTIESTSSSECFEYLSFSPKGGQLSTVVGNTSYKIWDVQDTVYLLNSVEGINTVDQITFSSDGKLLGVLSRKHQCKIMEVSSQSEHSYQQIWKLNQMKDQVDQMAFCSHNRYFAVSYTNGLVSVYQTDIQTTYQCSFHAHTASIKQMVFSPDGRYLAVTFESTLKLLNVQKQFLLSQLITNEDEQKINFISFSSCNEYIALALQNSCVNIYHFNRKRQLGLERTLIAHSAGVLQTLFSNDGHLLFTTSVDCCCKVWNKTNDYLLLKVIQIDNNILINQIQISVDCNYLITLSSDNLIRAWDITKDFSVIHQIAHQSRVKQIALQTDSQLLAVAYEDGYFKLFQTGLEFQNNGQLMKSNRNHAISIASFSYNRKYLATVEAQFDNDCTCKIWLQQNGFELYCTLKDHDQSITCLAFSQNSKYLASGSLDNTIKLWDITNDFDLFKVIEINNSPSQILFSPNSKYLAVGLIQSSKQLFRLWEIDNNFQEVISVNNQVISPFSRFQFSHSGNHLVIATMNGSCQIWNVEDHLQLLNNNIQCHEEQILSIAFSEDDLLMVTSGKEKICKVWDASKDFQMIMQSQTEDKVFKLVFSGNFLIGCEEKQNILIWRVDTDFLLVNKFKCCDSEILELQLSSDSSFLISCSKDIDSSTKIWKVSDCLVKISHILSYRHLMISENKQYILLYNFDESEYEIYSAAKGFQLIIAEKVDIKRRQNFQLIDDTYQYLIDSEILCYFYSLE